MPYDDERLDILQRVSNGELSPQDGQLEIAMLKVKYQQGHHEPGLERAAPQPSYDGQTTRENPGPFDRFLPPGFSLPWPMAVAFILPLVLIGAVLLVGLGLFMALPTYLLVNIWNQVVIGHPGWPSLAYWPTLGTVMAVFTVVTLLNWRRRLRAALQRQG